MNASDTFSNLMKERKNVTKFYENITIPDQYISSILEDAIQTPSGWNLQPWRFAVITTKEAKQKLLPIAFGQEQVVTSSMTVCIMADSEAHENFDKIYQPLMDSGHVSQRVHDILKSQVLKSMSFPENKKENLVLNASLSIMSMILSAESKGYSTGIIGGFDKKRFIEDFDLPKTYLPLALVNIGFAKEPAKKSTRLKIKDVTNFF